METGDNGRVPGLVAGKEGVLDKLTISENLDRSIREKVTLMAVVQTLVQGCDFGVIVGAWGRVELPL